MLKLQRPLTMYVARHSWGSAAKAKNVPLSVISEGMGHDSEATTQIYLASLETSAECPMQTKSIFGPPTIFRRNRVNESICFIQSFYLLSKKRVQR